MAGHAALLCSDPVRLRWELADNQLLARADLVSTGPPCNGTACNGTPLVSPRRAAPWRGGHASDTGECDLRRFRLREALELLGEVILLLADLRDRRFQLLRPRRLCARACHAGVGPRAVPERGAAKQSRRQQHDARRHDDVTQNP